MGNGNNGGFFGRVKSNLFKWWQLVIMPVLRINNDFTKSSERFAAGGQENAMQQNTMQQNAMQQNATQQNVSAQSNLQKEVTGNIDCGMQGKASNDSNIEGEDPMAVLNRINREKEQERLREIEMARQKAQEQERIASIMNANKVDVNAFIEAGKVAASEQKEKKPSPSEDEMRRAQEIIDRLNREAAADEAKKQAEIEAARKEAEKTFG